MSLTLNFGVKITKQKNSYHGMCDLQKREYS